MKQIVLFFTVVTLSATSALAKGHGHGGGHSGGHSHSGGSHSASRSTGGHINTGTHSGTGTHAVTGGNRTTAHPHARITRSTSPRSIAAMHTSSQPLNRAIPGTTATSRQMGHDPIYTAPATGAGYYYSPYYYSPYYYNPYYSMWSFGYGFMYSPSYYPVNSPLYNNSSSGEDQLSDEPMDGYVVFYNDTISGSVIIEKKGVALETTDSGKSYDYQFHAKDKGLQYVTVYNEDNKQLNLVRLKGNTKKLWRIVHTGKLNIYDSRRGFIYKPEDIDIKTLTVEYKGEVETYNATSADGAKKWLANYVNEAYGQNLDPTKFSWKELLIYVDKLD